MKLHLITAIILLPATIYAQSGSTKSSNQHVKAGFGVTIAQSEPQYPGGEEALNNFLSENLKYPRESKLNGTQGRVYVGFLVDKTGKISHERVLNGVNDELDAEAIRVVRNMPDWKPGLRAGEAIDVQYILAIDFVLPPKITEE
jgi:TonB family protein